MGIISKLRRLLANKMRSVGVVFREAPPVAIAPKIPGVSGGRLYAGASATRARRVIIGLDFGTSSTKAVIQLDHADRNYRQFLSLSHEVEVAGYGQLLCP